MPPRKRTSASTSTAKTAKAAPRPRRSSTVTASAFGAPELIVIADPAAALRIGAGGVESAGGADTRALNRVASRAAVTLRPLFGPEERVRLEARRLAPSAIGPVPDLSVYYHVDAPVADLADLAEELAGSDGVQGAYVKPAGRAAGAQRHGPRRRGRPTDHPGLRRQAALPRRRPGRRRRAVRVDLAGRRRRGCQHHRLRVGLAVRPRGPQRADQGGVVVGTAEHRHQPRHGGHRRDQRRPEQRRHHRDLPRRRRSAPPPSPAPPRRRIRSAPPTGWAPATSSCSRSTGPGPGTTSRPATTSSATSPSSGGRTTSPPSATRSAAASSSSRPPGNGAENLDDALYAARPPGFPALWTNPFNRANRDSGAVVVGAGAPPPGHPRA